MELLCSLRDLEALLPLELTITFFVDFLFTATETEDAADPEDDPDPEEPEDESLSESLPISSW